MSPSWFAPVPPAVAVEIAAHRVTVVEVRSGAPALDAYATEALPAGAVVPSLAGINITAHDVVAAALRRALENAGLRGARRAALVVPDGVARVSLLPFEQLPAAADLDNLIRLQLRKSMPFPLDDAQVTHFRASTQAGGLTLAAMVARRDVIGQYEAVTAAAGLHAGIVDLASLNVLNAIIAAGGSAAGDALVVCLAPDGTSLAILRGASLMFYRHRTTVDEEPLSALVHQTAMYHEDRLGGRTFDRVWLCGSSLLGASATPVREQLRARLGVPVENVDVRPAAELRDRAAATPDVLDALAAPVGVLLRERKAA